VAAILVGATLEAGVAATSAAAVTSRGNGS
jgi:hypothetical protein